jgi:hypothetical protein
LPLSSLRSSDLLRHFFRSYRSASSIHLNWLM